MQQRAMRIGWGPAAAGAVALALALGGAPAARATGVPEPAKGAARCAAPSPQRALASARELRRLARFEARLGLRATGSRTHQRFVAWLQRKIRAIDGIRIHARGFPIRRWDQRSASLKLHAGGRTLRIPIAAPIPYARGTGGDGVTRPLAYVPQGEDITRADAAGRIVVRDAPTPSVPLDSAFGRGSPLIWSTYDPGGTYAGAEWKRDFLGGSSIVSDIEDAGRAGAAGLLFVKPLPRRQLRDFYYPYEGLDWDVPGFYLGADEGRTITDAIAAGGTPTATLVQRVDHRRVVTRQFTATLRGRSRQLLVVDSHTDGTNVLEDDGPLAMIAIARYLARLPRSCRPRSVQFEFATAHFYQHLVKRQFPRREGGAEQAAQRLDRLYGKGRVAGVVVLEHLGARDYEPRPRAGGRPGDVLRATPRREPALVGVSESRPLVRAVEQMVRRHDLRRTTLLRGSDGADPSHVPLHCSFGGEGTPFEKHLLPTVSTIAAPAYLFNPAFGIETIDFGLMRRQTVAFTDLLMRMSRMSRHELAGAYSRYRRERAAGKPTCFDSEG